MPCLKQESRRRCIAENISYPGKSFGCHQFRSDIGLKRVHQSLWERKLNLGPGRRHHFSLRRVQIVLPTIVLIVAAVVPAATCECRECRDDAAASAKRRPAQQSQLTRSQTHNFDVYSYNAAWPATEVANLAEKKRSAIYEHWKGGVQAGEWQPKCVLVLHQTRQSYSGAVGRGSERTLGSSLLKVQQGVCRARRIDLIANEQNQPTALGHELTHVVISDIFQGQHLPRWLDEGIAILADSHEKQLRHADDWKQAQAGGTAFSLAGLVGLENYPAPSQFPAFYGGSASLTALLARRGDSTKLLEFAALSQSEGYDKALREVYQIAGLAQLDRIWRQSDEGGAYSLAQVER
jgi:hypothetical protein